LTKTGLKYYSEILLKGSVAVTIAESITKIISFLLLPLFTYYLSPKDYGITSMVMIVTTFLGLLYNLGMVSATTRLYHDTDSHLKKQELIGSSFYFFLFFPLIFMVLITLSGAYVFPLIFNEFDFYPYGFLAVLLAFFIQPKRIWTLLYTLQYKIQITAIYSVISVVISISVSLLLVVVFKMGALGKILGMFPSVLLLFIISYNKINKYTKGKWSFFSIKKQLKFGFPLIPAIWSYEILNIADRYILERMTDLATVGIYSMGYQIAQIPLFFVLGMRKLWNPVFYENMNKGDYKTLKRLVGYYVSFLSILCLLTILFSKEIFLLFVNNRYYDAIPVVSVIVIGVFFSALLTLTNSILGFYKQFWRTSKIALIASIMNIVLNIILIPYYGIMGAAITTTISYSLYLIIGFWFVRNTAKKLALYKPFIISSFMLILTVIYITRLSNTSLFSFYDFCFKILIVIIYVLILNFTKLFILSDLKKIKTLIKK